MSDAEELPTSSGLIEYYNSEQDNTSNDEDSDLEEPLPKRKRGKAKKYLFVRKFVSFDQALAELDNLDNSKCGF